MEGKNKFKPFKAKKVENNECLKSTIDLLKSIKSIYIFKYIFSFLYKKKKLNIIIYNKKLQKEFDITIDDYKSISDKIHIGYPLDSISINKKLNKYFTDITEEEKELIKEDETDVIKFIVNSMEVL